MATEVSGATSELRTRFLQGWVHRAMSLLDISFASGESSFSVRRIEVHEGVSTLYTATVWVHWASSPALAAPARA